MAQSGFADPRMIADMVAPSAASPAQARIRSFGVILLMLAVTFGQRFCVPFGVTQLPLTAPLAYVALIAFFMSGLTRINTAGFLLYAMTIFSIIATFFAPKTYFSAFSFFYLAGLYFVWLFSVDVDRDEYKRYLNVFQRIMMVMAGIAILQFAEQLATHTTFSIFSYVPKGFWMEGYNTRPTLGYESTFHKANGEFFLEPSFLSQYLAVAVIIEVLFFGNIKRLALYGAGMFCSFSGTGMMLVVLFLAVSMIKARRWELLYPLPVVLVLYVIFQDNPYVTAITGRVGEFGTEGSSASVRFSTPNQALFDLVFGNDFVAFLIGKGPGMVDQLGTLFRYGEANYPVFHKLMIEYGAVGTLPFCIFLLYSFFSRPRSRVLSAALFFMYAILSGSLLQPHTIFLCYVLAICMPIQQEEIDAKREAAAKPAFA